MKTKLLILLFSTGLFANDMCDYYFKQLQESNKNFKIYAKAKMFKEANNTVLQMEYNSKMIIETCKDNPAYQKMGYKGYNLAQEMKRVFGL